VCKSLSGGSRQALSTESLFAFVGEEAAENWSLQIRKPGEYGCFLPKMRLISVKQQGDHSLQSRRSDWTENQNFMLRKMLSITTSSHMITSNPLNPFLLSLSFFSKSALAPPLSSRPPSNGTG
jgi:hypothetical protein